MRFVADLSFKGLPTTPEQRDFFSSLGLKFGGAFVKEGKTWSESWVPVQNEADDPDYIGFSVQHGEDGDQYGTGCDGISSKVYRTLFPERARLGVGSKVEQLVFNNSDLLGFNLRHVNASEIIETLRALSERVYQVKHAFTNLGTCDNDATAHATNGTFETACGIKVRSFHRPGNTLLRGDYTAVKCDACLSILKALTTEV